jgi:MFS family permease
VKFRSVLTRRLSHNLVVNLLVAAVMMATLVVGPFYLGYALGLHQTAVGLVMAVGPVISIVSGVPSGQIVDKFGTGRVISAGLIALAAGAFLLVILPGRIGVTGYIFAIVVLTPGYQLFQAANNTASLADIPKDRRGVVSGVLNLSRNLGLLLGVSGLGAVFAFGVGTDELARASSGAIASGMQITFLLAGALLLASIWIAKQAAA